MHIHERNAEKKRINGLMEQLKKEKAQRKKEAREARA